MCVCSCNHNDAAAHIYNDDDDDNEKQNFNVIYFIDSDFCSFAFVSHTCGDAISGRIKKSKIIGKSRKKEKNDIGTLPFYQIAHVLLEQSFSHAQTIETRYE